MQIDQLKQHANSVRQKIVAMVHAAQSGHPGGSLSAADIITYLYYEVLDINEDNINSTNRNRFVLSKGHASPALYGILDELGLLHEDILTFRKLHSNLQGHPSIGLVPGVDMSTGSLGQGCSASVGMALANKLDNNGYDVYTLIGDGESEEGLVWEASMAAAHYKLDNLCFILDLNHLQIDGRIEEVMNPGSHVEKFKAFGFNVVECDGHDFESIAKAFASFKDNKGKGKPTAIIAHTIKGKGVSFMEDNGGWHGVAPNDEQYEIAMNDLKEAK